VLDELVPGVVVLGIGGGSNFLGGEGLGIVTRDEGYYSRIPGRQGTVRLTCLVSHRDLFEGIGGCAATR